MSELESSLELNEKVRQQQRSLDKWRSNLEETLETLYGNLLDEAKRSYDEKQKDLEDENEKLSARILETESVYMAHCQGKKVPHLERHQKHRKLKQLQTRDEKALFFMEQFGLKLEGITLHDEKGKHYNMEFPVSSTSTTIMPPSDRQKLSMATPVAPAQSRNTPTSRKKRRKKWKKSFSN